MAVELALAGQMHGTDLDAPINNRSRSQFRTLGRALTSLCLLIKPTMYRCETEAVTITGLPKLSLVTSSSKNSTLRGLRSSDSSADAPSVIMVLNQLNDIFG